MLISLILEDRCIGLIDANLTPRKKANNKQVKKPVIWTSSIDVYRKL